tara:strand:- start:17413 stop:17595 length:183 start_codon:yes stop_codon:yes gene_type:complete
MDSVRKAFLRRGDVMRELGVTKYQFECLVSSGALTAIILPGMYQRVFRRKEVLNYKIKDC